MKSYFIKIADICLRVEGFDDPYTEELFAPYVCSEEPEYVHVTWEKVSLPPCAPEGRKLTDRSSVNWYAPAEGCYSFVVREGDDDFFCARMDYDSKSQTAKVVLLDVETLYGIDTRFFLSNILERLFGVVLVLHGGFTVHSSSIVYEGEGVAFSARSGTGKSTHTSLWLENYPGTYILNDDSPAMRLRGDTWYIYGTPWAGTSGINQNMSVPLRGLVFLERSQDNYIREASAIESINRLFEAIVHPVSDELMGQVIASLSSFISRCNMCVLGCNMSPEAAETVRAYLYN